MDIPSFHYYTDITPHQLQLLASVFIPPSLKNNLRKKKTLFPHQETSFSIFKIEINLHILHINQSGH